MFFPPKEQIRDFFRKGLIVAIYKQINTIRDPYQAFSNIYSDRYSFLLESAKFHDKTGRFSFFGSEPFLIFKSKDNKVEIRENGSTLTFYGNPVDKLRETLQRFRGHSVQGLGDFTGGAVGYFSYDLCRFFENIPNGAADDLDVPDIHFALYDTIVCFDHLDGSAKIISNVMNDKSLSRAYDKAIGKIERLEKKLKKGCGENREKSKKPASKFTSTFTKNEFCDVVKKAKKYIKKGDIYQANLSQRFSAQVSCSPLELYRILRQINPSPFASMLNFDDIKIVSCSPERLLKIQRRLVQTRPIAGTRPRGKDEKQDKIFSKNLILSPKERAEHIMLVDLERNDLGRVCEYGSVRVNELMALERYSHVIHIVSNVCGMLRKDKDRFDLLEACFPGGTITGTPKVRCMEIIDELEPVRRGIYTGSIGYLGFDGDMDLNIAIRTFLLKDGRAHVQVGAGIVADSDPQREYNETLFKGQALFKALERV